MAGEAFHLGDAVVRIVGDLSDLEKSMSDTQAFMTGAFRGMSGLGQDLTKFVTLPIVGIGTASLFTAAQFDQAMRNVNAVMQLPEEQFRDLQEQVLDFATTTRAGATEVANALYNVAAAGYSGSEAFTIMEAAAHAAGASMSSTVVTSELLISTLKSYGFEAEKSQYLMDLFMATSNESVMTLTEVSHSMTTLTGLSSVMGISIEEVSAALATMNKVQTDSALAATYLRAMMQAMLTPGTELKKAYAEMGFESGAAAIQALGFSGVLEQLSLKYGENADALGKLFPDQRALLGSTILLKDGTQEYMATLGRLSQVEGAVERSREQQYETLLPQLDRLKNAFEVVTISVGMQFVPALAALVEQLVPVVRGFADVSAGTLAAATVLLGLVAAGGPLLMVIGQVGQFATALIAIIPLIGTWVASLEAAQIALVGLAAVGIPLLLVGFGLLVAALVKYQVDLAITSQKLLDTAESAEEYADGMDKARGVTDEMHAANERGRTAYWENQEALQRAADMALYASEEEKKMADSLQAAYAESDRLRKSSGELSDGLSDVAVSAEEASEAAAEMAMAMSLTRAKGALDVRESIESYRELRDKVIEFNYDVSDDVYKHGVDQERDTIDRNKAMAGLERDWADDRRRIADDAWMRSAEDTQHLYDTQAIIEVEELQRFNDIWDEKERRRDEDYTHAVGLAWQQAAERQKAEEAARVAEAETARLALEERVRLFAYEMLEAQGLTTVQFPGMEAMKLSAQEYMDLVDAGILPMTSEMQTAYVDAVHMMSQSWNEVPTMAQHQLDAQQTVAETAVTQMIAAKDAAAAATDVATPLEQAITPAIDRIEERMGTFGGGMEEVANTTGTAIGNIGTQMVGLQGETSTAMTNAQLEIQAGVGTITTSWGEAMTGMETGMQGTATEVMRIVRDLVRDMKAAFLGADWYSVGTAIMAQIQIAMEAKVEAMIAAIVRATRAGLQAAQDEIDSWGQGTAPPPDGEGGNDGVPRLDVGMNYVPQDMYAHISQGEAVLTRAEAAAWRAGKGGDGELGGGLIIRVDGNLVISPEALMNRDLASILDDQWRGFGG